MTPTPPIEMAIAVELFSRLGATLPPPLLNTIRNAAVAGTLTILRNGKEEPVGFVCWAGGNKDSVKIAEKFNLLPSNLWEFKEGNIALLLAVFFIYPFHEDAKKAFKQFLAGRRAVYYIKKNRKRLVVRTSQGFKYASIN